MLFRNILPKGWLVCREKFVRSSDKGAGWFPTVVEGGGGSYVSCAFYAETFPVNYDF
jgi:hypothetical protein